ncbi:MAG: bi-domain-containing oxidoreductase [Gammaproteobacteria bacterium]|nr:bi-domain-containing oxidoreductase [Gammaproteobacteria bacterium]
MKQILQNLKTGATEVAELPVPSVRKGQLLIATTQTLVSAGTERMLVEFGKASWLEKSRQQPDKVRMVLDKIKTDGLMPTIEAVFNKLDQPLPLGYCNVGRIVTLGDGVSGFKIGERVISNGKHAEVVSVPVNLCARVPDAVSDEEAAFTVLCAIALQGIRLVGPTLGETVAVIGLGLIGLVTVQLLRAHGCRVLGIDFDPDKLTLARQFGAEIVDLASGQDPVAAAVSYSRGRGVDAVVVTAATKSSEPMHQAALMCRKRGRIVLVGVTGLELSRADFFEKELSFQVSCSYGPGRYDANYEEKGQDYPVGFVRWTEQRNFEAVLDMMADGRIDVKPLISHRFSIGQAEKAYELIGGQGKSLGVLLEYPGLAIDDSVRTVKVLPEVSVFSTTNDVQGISVIGSGSYALSVLLPAFKRAGARFCCVASSAGVSGLHAARKFGFKETTTDTKRLFSDPSTKAIVITTRHDTHAKYVLQAIEAGKHVFVEKPLCLTLDELIEIESALKVAGQSSKGTSVPILMVGFNRRFAPHVQRIKQLLVGAPGPKSFIMTVNAGAIPAEHWTQDSEIGGGRIVGEACHFIDLLRFLANSPIVEWNRVDMSCPTEDTVTLQLRFADGSIGTIHYFANGNKAFPKERLEIFVNGRVLQLDNFRKLTAFGWPGFSKLNLWRQDKGQRACVLQFVKALSQDGVSPIPLKELIEVSRTSIEIAGVKR